MQESEKTYSVLQLTDTHLFDTPTNCPWGLLPDRMLEQTLNHIKIKHVGLEACLLTGDLVHDHSNAGYQRLFKHLETLGLSLVVLPGNHDDPVQLERVSAQYKTLYLKPLILGNWLIIPLDSTLKNEDKGHLSKKELMRLKTLLNASEKQHILICLHHHPVSIDSQWLDILMLDNASEFLSLVKRYPQIKAIVWGHIHQAYEQTLDNIKLLGSPSVSRQFKPRQDTFSIDPKGPGYRIIDLHPNGSLSSQAHWLT